jgi:hypothetical protein
MDLWNALPAKAGQTVMASVFDRTLSILVCRYITISPSEQRMRQFRGDVTTILFIASEALMWIAVTVDHLFDSLTIPISPLIRSIHVKCNKLLEAFCLVASPLHVLYKSAQEASLSCNYNSVSSSPNLIKVKVTEVRLPQY